jgi:hypothetical protein
MFHISDRGSADLSAMSGRTRFQVESSCHGWGRSKLSFSNLTRKETDENLSKYRSKLLHPAKSLGRKMMDDLRKIKQRLVRFWRDEKLKMKIAAQSPVGGAEVLTRV